MNSAAGNIVQFEYQGGTTPGQTRLVFVEQEDNRHYYTYDLEKKEPRNFYRCKCQNVRQPEFDEYQYLKDVSQDVGPDLVESYHQRGWQAVYSSVHQRFVAFKLKKPSVEFVISGHYVTVKDNVSGKYVQFIVNNGSSENISIYTKNFETKHNATLRDLITALEQLENELR